MARVPPEEVFTPASPVSDDMFATRKYEHLQDRVEAALREHGRQVVLFGLTGVGKTSLIGHLCRARHIRCVRVECGPTFEEMMREALAKVVGQQEIERIEKESVEAGVGATLYGLLRGDIKASAGAEIKYESFPVSLATAAAEAFRLMDVKVLFLDNFENLQRKPHGEAATRSIAELMKSFADRSAEIGVDAPRVVVAGIPDASAALIGLDEATARRTAQVEVPRMPDDELDQILSRGETKLGITFEGLLRDRIIQSSDGFPYYTHMFALHCSRRAIHAGREDVKLDDSDVSLASILADCDLELRTAYETAVETTGEVQMRKSVMEAIATLNDLEVPFKAIRESFLKLHPEYGSADKLNFLSTAITPLKDTYRILADSNKPKSPKQQVSICQSTDAWLRTSSDVERGPSTARRLALAEEARNGGPNDPSTMRAPLDASTAALSPRRCAGGLAARDVQLLVSGYKPKAVALAAASMRSCCSLGETKCCPSAPASEAHERLLRHAWHHAEDA